MSKAERDALNAAQNRRRAAARSQDAEKAKADPPGWRLELEERRARARATKRAQREAARQRQPEGGSEPGDANAPAPVPRRGM